MVSGPSAVRNMGNSPGAVNAGVPINTAPEGATMGNGPGWVIDVPAPSALGSREEERKEVVRLG
jgi:hypothetical protein